MGCESCWYFIKNAKGETVKIPFKRFPTDATEKTDICVNLYDDGVKQIGYQEQILSLNDLQKRNVTKIDLTYTQYIVMMVMWEKESISCPSNLNKGSPEGDGNYGTSDDSGYNCI